MFYSPSERLNNTCEPTFKVISEDSLDVQGTTLLKALPYSGIDKDEADEINDCIRELKEDYFPIKKGYEESGLVNSKLFDIIRLTGVVTGSSPFRAGRVLQVISVKISKLNNESLGDGFQIYGEISLTDYRGKTFYLYNKDSTNSELISSINTSLSLDDCPGVPVLSGSLKISLTNKDTGVKIIDGIQNVDYTAKDASGEKSTLVFGGGRGYCAEMVLIKIPFATIAMVTMFLHDNISPPEGTFDVHGKIIANEIVCFEQNVSNPRKMVYGEKNVFRCRTFFAVPVYSALCFKIKLYSGNDEIYDGELVLNSRESRKQYIDFPCQDNYQFGVDLVWIPQEVIFGCNDEWWVDDENLKLYRILPGVAYRPVGDEDSSLVEVFSIFVGGEDSSHYSHLFGLCGSVVVKDQNQAKTCYIFARDEKHPDLLSHHMSPKKLPTLLLTWSDRWVVEKEFYMHLKLKDVHGNPICRGYLDLYNHWSGCPPCYDRPVCAVIPSKNGYFAAVHYAVFKNGKKTKVTMKWSGHDCFVYGSVCAEYGGYDYPSTYDKECYRSIIFERSMEECVKVENSSEIPLSKSHISAPSDCKKINVCVKLVVIRPSMVNASYDQVDEYVLRFNRGKRSKVLHFYNRGHITVEMELP